MIRAGWRVRINRLPPEVFDFVSNLNNEPQFVAEASNVVQVTPGAIGLGTVFTEEFEKMGSFETTIDHFERPGSVGFVARGEKCDVNILFRFIQRGKAGTDVYCDLELTLKGLSRLFERMIGKKIRQTVGETRGPALKRAIEGDEAVKPEGPWRREHAS
jgi:hypothetical protein